MKKTLLIAGLALAASVITSQAQVYSQNIVGYVNTPVAGNFTAIANPLDNATGNSLTNLLPGIVSGAFDNSYIYIWTGAGYNTFFCDSSQGGLNDSGDNGNVPSPTINPGVTFFMNNKSASNTVTFVGTVHVEGAGASTNVVGTNTLLLSGLNFVASKLPVGGGLNTVLELPTSNGSMDNDYIYIPSISPSGALQGFATYFVDSSLGGTGIADSGDNGLVSPEPSVSVGTGFFVKAVNPVNWVQSY